MDKIESEDLKRIVEKEKKKKKAVTLYLDPEIIEVVREHLKKGESISLLINNILEHISKVMIEEDKEIQDKKEGNESG